MTPVPELPAFLYDGDCAFCSTCARFIERHIPTAATVVPSQWTDLAAIGVSAAEVDEAVVWVHAPTEHTTGPAAIADLLRSSTARPWRVVGAALALAPITWAAGFGYRWVARNRHRMPGGTAQCSLPQAERSPRS